MGGSGTSKSCEEGGVAGERELESARSRSGWFIRVYATTFSERLLGSLRSNPPYTATAHPLQALPIRG
jgi:hypothetical protein